MAALSEGGVNLIAVWGYPMGPDAQFEMVTDDAAKLVKAAKKCGLKLGPKQSSIYVSGRDGAGIIADIFAKLAAAGINVGAAQAVASEDGSYGAVFFLGAKDIKKGLEALSPGKVGRKR